MINSRKDRNFIIFVLRVFLNNMKKELILCIHRDTWLISAESLYFLYVINNYR